MPNCCLSPPLPPHHHTHTRVQLLEQRCHSGRSWSLPSATALVHRFVKVGEGRAQAIKQIAPLSSQRSWLHSQWGLGSSNLRAVSGTVGAGAERRGRRSAALMKSRPRARPGASSRRRENERLGPNLKHDLRNCFFKGARICSDLFVSQFMPQNIAENS